MIGVGKIADAILYKDRILRPKRAFDATIGDDPHDRDANENQLRNEWANKGERDTR